MFLIPDSVTVHPTARIDVQDGSIGPRSMVGAHVRIEGRHVTIGAEAWIDEYAVIGGGSCFDREAYLHAGDFLHMGMFSQINTARGVVIGDECGIGIRTGIFTHGAYLSALEGFPVQWGQVTIGDRVWLPNTWVNPGVSIGSDVVVAAMSLVNSDLPTGCLAGGIPAKVIKANEYPKYINDNKREEIIKGIINTIQRTYPDLYIAYTVRDTLYIPSANITFDLKRHTIRGRTSEIASAVKNQFRRNGIRFKYYVNGSGDYVPWPQKEY